MGHAWVNITYMSDDDFKTEVAARQKLRAGSSNTQQ